MQKVKLVCPHCGTDQIGCEAYAHWSETAQEWFLAGCYDDHNYCNDCEAEFVTPKEIEITGSAEPPEKTYSKEPATGSAGVLDDCWAVIATFTDSGDYEVIAYVDTETMADGLIKFLEG